MASEILFKYYACNTRKEVLQKVYDTIIADSTNWEVIHEEGGYDSSSPADQDYIVLEATTPHPGTEYHMQILLCARDAISASATFGGSAGTKWTILDDSFAMIVSRDGGWNSTSKDFSDNPGTLPERQQNFPGSASATPGYSVSCGTTADEFWIKGQETSIVFCLAVGMLQRYATTGTQRRIAAFFGLLNLSGNTSESWSNTTTPVGAVPNADDDGWNSAVTDVTALRIDTYPADSESGEYIERYLEVFRIPTGGCYGRWKSLMRVGTSVAGRSTFNSATRMVSSGVSFPWEA